MQRKLQLLFLPLLVSMLFFGCRDKCKKLDCGENGTCVEGTCVCEDGYEGGLCEETNNAKYNKTYSLTEVCNAGSDFYDVVMFPDPSNPSRLGISGLWERAADTVYADVALDGLSFAIEWQDLGNVQISGTGTALDIFGIDLEVSYQIRYPGQSLPFDNCTADLSQK